MANLKLDLANKLNNEKYYEEIELIRLAQDGNTNYRKKIEDMSIILKNITIINAELNLIEQYFKEPEQQNPPQTQQGNVQQGQSHRE